MMREAKQHTMSLGEDFEKLVPGITEELKDPTEIERKEKTDDPLQSGSNFLMETEMKR